MRTTKRRRKRWMPAWKREEFYERMHKCKVLLLMNGVLTDAESRRVHKRMLKMIDRERNANH